MSKQGMARELIGLGSTLSFNTLRRYDADVLASMLAEASVALCVDRPCTTVEPVGVACEAVLESVPFHVQDECSECGVVGETTQGACSTCVVEQSYVPTDAELMRPVVEERTELDIPPVASTSRLQHALALVFAPWLMLKGIVGL